VQLSVKHVEPCTGASTTKSAADTASLTTSDPVAAQADTLQYDLNKAPVPALGQTRPQLPALRRGQRYPLATLLQALPEHTPTAAGASTTNRTSGSALPSTNSPPPCSHAPR
jgi:hypothetical protein